MRVVWGGFGFFWRGPWRDLWGHLGRLAGGWGEGLGEGWASCVRSLGGGIGGRVWVGLEWSGPAYDEKLIAVYSLDVVYTAIAWGSGGV